MQREMVDECYGHIQYNQKLYEMKQENNLLLSTIH